MSIRDPKLASPADAEEVAVGALSYLASDEERLTRFLDVTGLRPDTLRRAAASSGFLVSVLDYVAADERLVLGLADRLGIPPERIIQAGSALSRAHQAEDF